MYQNNTMENYEDLETNLGKVQNKIKSMKVNAFNDAFIDYPTGVYRECSGQELANNGNNFGRGGAERRQHRRNAREIPYIADRPPQGIPLIQLQPLHNAAIGGRPTRINYTIQDTIHCESCREDIRLDIKSYPQAIQDHMITNAHVVLTIPTQIHQSKWFNVRTKFKCLKCNYDTASFGQFILHIGENLDEHIIQQININQHNNDIIVIED
jgi:DNA-directed RNA polymerase subunit M/transcription elongation factor TFIIS